MTVSSEDFRISHNGGGTTGPFSFNFLAYELEHLEVVKLNLEGDEVTLEPGTDFTAEGLGEEEGGTIELSEVLEVGEKITITVNPPPTQELDLNDDDDFPAEAVERQLDLMVMMLRRDRTVLERALVLRTSDVDGSGAFNARGNRITNVGNAVEDDDVLTLGAASSFLTAFEGYATAASDSADAAAESAVTAAGHVTSAAAQVTLASGYASDADNSAELAQRWASEEANVVVADGKYSAYHYMLQAAAIADVEASGIPINAIDGMTADNVQAALEEIDDALDIVIGDTQDVADDLADALVAIDGDFDSVDAALSGKANASHTHLMSDITDLALPTNSLLVVRGFTVAVNVTDSSHDHDISAGVCYSDDLTTLMVGSAKTKQTDAAWAAGNNAGGRQTALGNNTLCHWLAIYHPTNGVDYICKPVATALSLPAGYTKSRHIRYFYTDGSGNILADYQDPKNPSEVWLNAPKSEVAVENDTTTSVTVTSAAPPNTLALLSVSYYGSTYFTSGTRYAQNSALRIRPMSEADAAPSLTNFTLYSPADPGDTGTYQYGATVNGQVQVRTDASRQYAYRKKGLGGSAFGAMPRLDILLNGWRDERVV